MSLTINVNGADHTVDATPETPLLYVLRGDLGLNGAKFGCGLGQCGACTVMVGGAAVLSCLTPLSAVGTRPVKTIEGLGTVDKPGVLQRAFLDEQAAQCRIQRQFCGADQIAAAIGLGLREAEKLARATFRIVPDPAMQEHEHRPSRRFTGRQCFHACPSSCA